MRKTFALLAMLLWGATLAAQEPPPAGDPWEEPGSFEASEILAPELRKGDHYEVEENVPTRSFYYDFTVKTDFGQLEVLGLSVLRKRVRETEALAALDEVSKTGVFVNAAGQSLVSLGKGVANVVVDPVGTATGLGAGIKRFGVNLGRKTKRVVAGATDDDEGGDDESTGEKTANVANSVLGVNKAARTWARKLEVDPYSRNPILQEALIEVARIDAAGGIAAKIAVPIPPVVGTTVSVGNLVWGKDPEELRKTNEAGLKGLGVPDEVAERFFRNDNFTITDQTRFVAALTAVGAKGLADYVDAAARGADHPRDALFYVESAEMLRRLHGEGAVSAVLTDSQTMVALAGGKAVALLPLDYVAWTESVAGPVAEIAARAKAELGAGGLEMQLTGTFSERAREELEALGWTLEEQVSAEVPAGE